MFTAEFPKIKLELFDFDPCSDKISSAQFELLLKMTHEALHRKSARNQIEKRLVPYSGPQCNEDRENEKLLHYNVNF